MSLAVAIAALAAVVALPSLPAMSLSEWARSRKAPQSSSRPYLRYTDLIRGDASMSVNGGWSSQRLRSRFFRYPRQRRQLFVIPLGSKRAHNRTERDKSGISPRPRAVSNLARYVHVDAALLERGGRERIHAGFSADARSLCCERFRVRDGLAQVDSLAH